MRVHIVSCRRHSPWIISLMFAASKRTHRRKAVAGLDLPQYLLKLFEKAFVIQLVQMAAPYQPSQPMLQGVQSTVARLS